MIFKKYDLLALDLWQIGATFYSLITNKDPQLIFKEPSPVFKKDMSLEDKVEIVLGFIKENSQVKLKESFELKIFLRSFLSFLTEKPEDQASLDKVLSDLKEYEMIAWLRSSTLNYSSESKTLKPTLSSRSNLASVM